MTVYVAWFIAKDIFMTFLTVKCVLNFLSLKQNCVNCYKTT